MSEAALAIQSFVADMGMTAYAVNAMAQAAVERKFEIIGDALKQLAKFDSTATARIRDLPQIVAFRNQLIHATPPSTWARFGTLPRTPCSHCLTQCRRCSTNSISFAMLFVAACANPKRASALFRAPLLFARNAVSIAVHLRTGTLLQEQGCLSTRGHLAAYGAPVAFEVCRHG